MFKDSLLNQNTLFENDPLTQNALKKNQFDMILITLFYCF